MRFEKNEGETHTSPYAHRDGYYTYFIPFPSSSFRIRFRKSLTIRGKPSLSGTFGSQFSSSFALVISGFLICGSSAVFALYSIVALESIVSLTTCMFLKI
ncbi:UDP-glucuronic acid decarboxylase [Trifolium repens]|nr:UDP-glucuronic acid decarboxylase [Trifolium repens]